MRIGFFGLVASLWSCSLLLEGSQSDSDASPDGPISACTVECESPTVCDNSTGECVTCDQIVSPGPSAADEACPSGVCDRVMASCAEEDDVAYLVPGTASDATCERDDPCPTFDRALANVDIKPIVFVAGETLIGTGVSGDNLPPSATVRIYGYGVEWQSSRPVALGPSFFGSIHLEGFDINGSDQPVANNVGVSVEDGTLSLRRVTIRNVGGSSTSHGVASIDGTLAMDGCVVIDNEDRGITIDTSDFTIRNTLIARNGLNGVRITNASAKAITGDFSFNTVADHQVNGEFLCNGDLAGSYTARGNLFVPDGGTIGCDNGDQLRFEHSYAKGYPVTSPTNLPDTPEPATDPSTYRLMSSDAGVDITALLEFVNDGERDADGNPRVIGAAPDIGAYEYEP